MNDSPSDLRSLDLNLLPVFAALMRERSVTRAGEALFLSQPATSAALARLRSVFHDELFIRNGRILEPTPRAEQLLAELAPALQSIAGAVAGAVPFDPATDERVFHIGCTEDMVLAAGPVLRAIRAQAPKSRFAIHAANYQTIPALMEAGTIGTALGFIDALPATAKQRVLRRSGFRVLRGAASPGPVDLDMFCARPHVLVTMRGDLHGFVDVALEKLGRKRNVVIGIPDFGVIPFMLRRGQLLCTVSDTLADLLVSEDLGLTSDPPPFVCQDSVIHIAWRGALDHDPAEMWLRGQLIDYFSKKQPLRWVPTT
jgi:LysR family transcriptional activator of mexEF-oprN operon